MKLASFIEQQRIKITCQYADSNPHMANDNWQANHYKVTLRSNGKQLTTYFSKGIGLSGEPTVAEVLDCLASDAAGYENCQSFEDWASEYGYDTDSRKAEKAYKITSKQADKLRDFLGGPEYDTLLWSVERD